MHDIEANQEIHTSYAHNNQEIFFGYGFMQESHDKDVVLIFLDLDKNDPNYKLKKAIDAYDDNEHYFELKARLDD
jgi:hypothetical protein